MVDYKLLKEMICKSTKWRVSAIGLKWCTGVLNAVS